MSLRKVVSGTTKPKSHKNKQVKQEEEDERDSLLGDNNQDEEVEYLDVSYHPNGDLE